MISASLRQRIGDLLRRDPRREVSFPRPESRVVPTSIEDVLPGGIVIGREGACFVHERLYTELNEHPIQLLKKFDLIAHPELAEGGPALGASRFQWRADRARRAASPARLAGAP